MKKDKKIIIKRISVLLVLCFVIDLYYHKWAYYYGLFREPLWVYHLYQFRTENRQNNSIIPPIMPYKKSILYKFYLIHKMKEIY